MFVFRGKGRGEGGGCSLIFGGVIFFRPFFILSRLFDGFVPIFCILLGGSGEECGTLL